MLKAEGVDGYQARNMVQRLQREDRQKGRDAVDNKGLAQLVRRFEKAAEKDHIEQAEDEQRTAEGKEIGVHQRVLSVDRRIRQAEAEGRPAAAIDAIALFESGLDRMCDRTLAVLAPAELRIRRIMAREGVSEEYARTRVNSQHTDDWFRSRCDVTLENTEADTKETFSQRARALFQSILEEETP